MANIKHILLNILSIIIKYILPTILIIGISTLIFNYFVPQYGYINTLKYIYILNMPPQGGILRNTPLLGILIYLLPYIFPVFCIFGLIFSPDLRLFIIILGLGLLLLTHAINYITTKGIIGLVLGIILSITSAILIYLYI